MGEPEAVRHGEHNTAAAEVNPEQDEPPSIPRPPPIPNPVPQRPAHSVPVTDIGLLWQTDLENGLSKADAAARLERDGPNRIEGAKGLSIWEIVMRQISNSLTLVLVIVMILSFAIQDYIEGGVITAVILLNIVVG